MIKISNTLKSLTLLLILMPFALHGASQSSGRTIDFTHTSNLKAIFDAGLKPWRLPGLESYQCELGNESLKIILSENCAFNLDIERADIIVLAGNQLSSIELDCPQMAYTDAAKQVDKICQAAGISTTEFDDYISSLSQNVHKPLPRPLVTKKYGVELHVIYAITPINPLPPVGITVTLTWAQSNGVMQFLTEPIKPPPGYENVSMDSPTKSAQNTSGPNSNPTQSRGAYQQQGSSDTASMPTHSTSQSSSSQFQSKTSPNESSSRDSWLTSKFGLWALVLIAAAMLGFYIIRKK